MMSGKQIWKFEFSKLISISNFCFFDKKSLKILKTIFWLEGLKFLHNRENVKIEAL